MARTSWETPWRTIGEQIVPYGSLWVPRQRNRGEWRNSKIINSTPTQALKTQAAGMMAGITSPARKWFALTPTDKALLKSKAVRVHLDELEKAISAALQTSNLYKVLANAIYPGLGSIGTAFMIEEEAREPGKVMFDPYPIGQYYLDVDHEGTVDTAFIELAMTTRQLVQKFGIEKVSQQVKQAYDRGDYDNSFLVARAIMPNNEYKPGAIGPRGFPVASCWWEQETGQKDKLLAESGYEEFPGMAPRWSVLGDDAYGRGPGWDVVGDCLELQHHEIRKMEMIDQIAKPALLVRGNVRDTSLLPGAIMRAPRGQETGVAPAHVIDPRAIAEVRASIAELKESIQTGMFADLWRRLIDDDRNQRATATEIQALREETMLMAGPLLENLNIDLLAPIVTRTHNILARRGMLPRPPDELMGQPLKPEFISVLHQMQQQQGLIGMRTLLGELAQLAQLRPEAIDKIDPDAYMDEVAGITGINPAIILSKDEVTAIRQHRAEQQAAQQNGQAMLAATQGVKNLSSADPQKLSDLAGLFPTSVSAQGGALAPVKTG